MSEPSRSACAICSAIVVPSPATVPVQATDRGWVVPLAVCSRHEDALREDLQLVTQRVRETVLSHAGSGRLRLGESAAAVRAWAREQGIPCSTFGQPSRSLLAAYRAARGMSVRDGDPVVVDA